MVHVGINAICVHGSCLLAWRLCCGRGHDAKGVAELWLLLARLCWSFDLLLWLASKPNAELRGALRCCWPFQILLDVVTAVAAAPNLRHPCRWR